MPKFNLYQSLHTTVVGPQGKPSRSRSAPRRCTNAPSSASPRTGATRRPRPHRDLAWLQRIVDWQNETTDPAEFMASLKIDLEQDEVFVFTPKGNVITLPDGRDAGRLRLRDPHRGRPPLHRRPGQRPAGAARLRRCSSGDTVEIFTSKVERRGPDPRLAAVRASPRAATRSASGSPGAARGRDRDRPRRAGSRRCAARACRCRSSGSRRRSTRSPRSCNYADLDALYAAIGEHHVSAKAVAAAAPADLEDVDAAARNSSPTTVHAPRRCGPARRHRQPACTSRVSTTSWCGCRAAARRCRATRSWASSPAAAACRCTAPTAPTPSVAAVGQADRVIEVEWDNDSRPRSTWSRSRSRRSTAPTSCATSPTCSPSTTSTSSSCTTQTGPTASPRCASSSSSPTRATSTRCSGGIKQVDGVYDAYRVLPGKGEVVVPMPPGGGYDSDRDRGAGEQGAAGGVGADRPLRGEDASPTPPDVGMTSGVGSVDGPCRSLPPAVPPRPAELRRHRAPALGVGACGREIGESSAVHRRFRCRHGGADHHVGPDDNDDRSADHHDAGG